MRDREAQFASSQSVFYSRNRPSGFDNLDLAIRHVLLNPGKQTIEMTDGGRWLTQKLAANNSELGKKLTLKQRIALWRQASMYFARRSSGTADAVVGGYDWENRHNIFFKDELPRLNDNANIDSIRAFIIIE